MPKFNLHFGFKEEGQFKMFSELVELKDLRTACAEAREYAEDLYMQNPVRDVNEIMKQEKWIDEDTASILFKLDMFRNTVYFAEEVK